MIRVYFVNRPTPFWTEFGYLDIDENEKDMIRKGTKFGNLIENVRLGRIEKTKPKRTRI